MQRLQLLAIEARIKRPAAHADIGTFGAREADETHARVAVMICLAPRYRARESLLAMEAVARRDDDVACVIARQRGPEGLLNRL